MASLSELQMTVDMIHAAVKDLNGIIERLGVEAPPSTTLAIAHADMGDAAEVVGPSRERKASVAVAVSETVKKRPVRWWQKMFRRPR